VLAGDHTMRQIATGGISALLLLVGCVHEKPVAPRPAATPAAPQNAGSAQKPQTAPAPVAAVPAQPPTQSPPQPPPAPAEAGTPPGSAAADTERARGAAARSSRSGATGSAAASGTAGAPGSGNTKTRPPGGSESTANSAPHAAAPGSASQGATAGGTTAHSVPSPAPALDLASLEQRLRDTRAIGVFTKLSLKNQVDDLLGEFRAFHRRQGTVTVDELRQKYDLLLLKVLSLLQDGDQPLAAAISSSREAIWAMLIDPQQFEKLARN
jgi:hypothetical protein